MHKLRKFFYDNKSKIIKISSFVIFSIIILQIINNLVKNRKTNQSSSLINENKVSSISQKENGLVSNKSAVTGNEVQSNKLERETDIINSFVNFCNNQELEKAYDLISEDCKKQIYSSIEIFEKAYYNDVFNGKEEKCTIENWFNDTYKVRMIEDILSTGKNDELEKEDYITVVLENETYKLNINSYIGMKNINKTTQYDDIVMEVLCKYTYKDYEQYKIRVTNNKEGTVKLDTVNSPNTIYIEDDKGVAYSYYNHELTNEMLTITEGQTKEITIKFYSLYSSNKNIKSIVFSNIITKIGRINFKSEFKANI